MHQLHPVNDHMSQKHEAGMNVRSPLQTGKHLSTATRNPQWNCVA